MSTFHHYHIIISPIFPISCFVIFTTSHKKNRFLLISFHTETHIPPLVITYYQVITVNILWIKCTFEHVFSQSFFSLFYFIFYLLLGIRRKISDLLSIQTATEASNKKKIHIFNQHHHHHHHLVLKLYFRVCFIHYYSTGTTSVY